MKKWYLGTLIVFTVFMLVACANVSDKKKLSEINIKSGKIEIPIIAKYGVVKNIEYKDINFFQSVIKDNQKKIPYIKLGEKIQIEFRDTNPDKCELRDYILNKDGTVKYGKPTIKKVDIKFKNKKGLFTLNENVWINLSSNSKDYKQGAVFRGFQLICNWGDEKQEYLFAVKTDATKKRHELK